MPTFDKAGILAATFALFASAAIGQDEVPLPSVGELLDGVDIFACVVEVPGGSEIAFFPFRSHAGRTVLLTDNGALEAHSAEGVYAVFDESRMVSMHFGDGESGVIVGQRHRAMQCQQVNVDMRRMLRRLAQE